MKFTIKNRAGVIVEEGEDDIERLKKHFKNFYDASDNVEIQIFNEKNKLVARQKIGSNRLVFLKNRTKKQLVREVLINLSRAELSRLIKNIAIVSEVLTDLKNEDYIKKNYNK